VFLLACGLLLHAQLPSLPGGPSTAPAKPLADGAVRVISESGRVSWIRSGGDLWALVEGEVVPANHVIVAESDGHALLELSDHSRVEVFPNSRLTFGSSRLTMKDLLDLTLGKVRIHIEKIGGLPNFYKMFAPTAIIAVRGTTFDVEVEPGGTTTVSVEEGLVDVTDRRKSGGDPVKLGAGQSLKIDANEPLAQSKKADKLRTIVKVGANVAERAAEVIRQVDATKIPGTTGTSTTASSTTSTSTATVGTGTASGSGTSTPPSNGRGSGSGNNGDTNPGTPVSPTNPGSGSGSTGSGSSGGGSGTASAGATTQSRKP
jgi:hypothetical protein